MENHQQKTIQLTVPLQALDIIVVALRKMPYENVADLLMDLDKQYRTWYSQQQQQQPPTVPVTP